MCLRLIASPCTRIAALLAADIACIKVDKAAWAVVQSCFDNAVYTTRSGLTGESSFVAIILFALAILLVAGPLMAGTSIMEFIP